MLTNPQKQSGSAHVVVMILLIVALVGALGFIFYQNFMKQDSATVTTAPDETTQEVKNEEVAEAYKGERTSALDGTYSVKIPNGWKVTRNTDETSNIQQTMGIDGLIYDESKQPEIKDDLIGGHDAMLFSIDNSAFDYPPFDSENRTTFTTDSGIVGEKIESFTPANDDQAMYSDYDTYYYRWVFSKNEHTVYISWPQALTPGTKPDSAQLQLLEDVARSLEIK